MKRKHKTVKGALALATVPVLLATVNQPEVLAEKTCSTEQECAALIEGAQNEIEELEKETQEKEQNLTAVENDIESLMIRVEETVQKITQTEKEIKQKTVEIKASKQELAQLQTEIGDLKETVGVRMRVSHRLTHSNLILNWLSESTSLAKLIQSLQTINQFAANDSVQMDQLKGLVSTQNQLMATLKTQQQALNESKKALEVNRAQLEADQATLEAKRKAVKKEIQALEREKLSAQEAKEIAQAQKELLERLAAEEEARRQAEEEKRRQEEEEKKKQEAIQQQQESASTSESSEDEALNAITSTEQNDSTPSSPSPVIPSSATFQIPLATGYVSCEFMCYSGHNGIDLGNSGNTSTPVLATASGIVTRSGWHHAYGNHVMITHNIDGKIYTTVYAHMHTTPYVKVGDVVYQGQQVGTMGNTGNSFGAHLHFELYEGYYNYPYSVNPRKYINFPSRW